MAEPIPATNEELMREFFETNSLAEHIPPEEWREVETEDDDEDVPEAGDPADEGPSDAEREFAGLAEVKVMGHFRNGKWVKPHVRGALALPDLDPQEKAVLTRWRASSHGSIVRGYGEDGRPESDEAKLFDRAVRKLPPESGVVYRGINMVVKDQDGYRVRDDPDEVADALRSSLSKEPIQWNRPVSTSTSPTTMEKLSLGPNARVVFRITSDRLRNVNPYGFDREAWEVERVLLPGGYELESVTVEEFPVNDPFAGSSYGGTIRIPVVNLIDPNEANLSEVSVKGYVRRDGTVVKPHVRKLVRGLGDLDFDQVREIASLHKDDYVGKIWEAPDWDQIDSDEQSRRWAVERERRKEWERAVKLAATFNLIPDEELHANGWWGEDNSALKSGSYDWVSGFGPLPDTLYHVTTDWRAVEQSGLKTRDELRQERGAGLGGGSDDTISFTTDPELARGLHASMLEARAVAAGEITLDDLIQQAIRGDNADRPYIGEILGEQMMEEFRSTAELPTSFRRQWSSEHKYEAKIMPMSVEDFRAQVAKELEGADPEPSNPYMYSVRRRWQSPEDWEPVEETRWQDGPKYSVFRRRLTDFEARERAWEFYNTMLWHRQSAGGPENPVFFSTDFMALGQKRPEDIGVIVAHPVETEGGVARGIPMGGMSEWRVFTGAAINIERIGERPDDVSLSEWREWLHPRGKGGRFIKKLGKAAGTSKPPKRLRDAAETFPDAADMEMLTDIPIGARVRLSSPSGYEREGILFRRHKDGDTPTLGILTEDGPLNTAFNDPNLTLERLDGDGEVDLAAMAERVRADLDSWDPPPTPDPVEIPDVSDEFWAEKFKSMALAEGNIWKIGKDKWGAPYTEKDFGPRGVASWINKPGSFEFQRRKRDVLSSGAVWNDAVANAILNDWARDWARKNGYLDDANPDPFFLNWRIEYGAGSATTRMPDYKVKISPEVFEWMWGVWAKDRGLSNTDLPSSGKHRWIQPFSDFWSYQSTKDMIEGAFNSFTDPLTEKPFDPQFYGQLRDALSPQFGAYSLDFPGSWIPTFNPRSYDPKTKTFKSVVWMQSAPETTRTVRLVSRNLPNTYWYERKVGAGRSLDVVPDDRAIRQEEKIRWFGRIAFGRLYERVANDPQTAPTREYVRKVEESVIAKKSRINQLMNARFGITDPTEREINKQEIQELTRTMYEEEQNLKAAVRGLDEIKRRQWVEMMEKDFGIKMAEEGSLNASSHVSLVPLQFSVQAYPEKWVEASNRAGKIGVAPPDRLLGDNRAFYRDSSHLAGNGSAEIYLPAASKYSGAKDPVHVGVHELGHRMEYAIPGLAAMEAAFHYDRTRGDKIEFYAEGEYAKPDRFVELYTGKMYSGDSWEVFTMAMQSLFPWSSSDGDRSQWMNDPDYLALAIGMVILR